MRRFHPRALPIAYTRGRPFQGRTQWQHGRRIAGTILAGVGAAVLFRTWQDARSLGNEITSAVSGSPTDDVIDRYSGGGVALALGLYALLVGR